MKVSAEVRFSPVPEWVIFHPDLSAQAVRVYAVLARFADDNGAAMPSRKTIAARACVSVATVRRAVAELAAVGAIEIRPRFIEGKGEQTSNEYLLRVSTPGSQMSLPPGSPVSRRGVTREPTPRLTREPQNESLSEREVFISGDGLRRPVENGSGSKAKPRQRDEMFEVLAEITGYDLAALTTDARGRLNGAAKQLREVGAEPDEVRAFAGLWGWQYPEATLTPQTVTSNWAQFKGGSMARRTR